MSRILEIKRHLNKPDEHYLCDLLRLGKNDVVLKYVSEKPAKLGDGVFEPGSITYAYYRTGSGFALWKMYGPDGNLRGHLFHICRDLRVSQDRVEYLDLLLDIWISPEGSITVLDRDELQACAAKGMVDEEDLAWIAHHEEKIRKSWKRIVSSLKEF